MALSLGIIPTFRFEVKAELDQDWPAPTGSPKVHQVAPFLQLGTGERQPYFTL